jgi:chemotaxis protein methyltransferase CheR
MGGPAGVTLRRPLLHPPDPTFARLKELIAERTGHAYYEDKDDLLWERLARRLRASGVADTAGYLELLEDAAAGAAEWEALTAEIMVGETFFFRYAEQFAALQDAILPAIIAANRGSRRIRIWSAGCANGAEPYSVGILLRRLLGEEIAEWHVTILGTDINAAAVAAARSGRFGAWSLRTLPGEERMRDFIPSEGGRVWTLRPQHRAMVSFAQHNLMQLLDGTSPLQLTDFDLILCRNVLIYFRPDTAARLVRTLAERLVERGWLLLGHAEAGTALQHGLATVELEGTLAYRRGPPGAASSAARHGCAAEPVAAPDAPSAPWPLPAPRPAPPPVAAAPPHDAGPPAEAAELLAEARRLADRGDLGGAWHACRAGLERDPTNAVLHYVEGLIAGELGEPTAAEQAYRRAVYLRSDFVMAHHQLGRLLADAGQMAAGRRAMANALRVALAMPDRAVLAEGDGMTAKDFRDLARLHLSLESGDA